MIDRFKFRAWHVDEKRMYPPWSIWKSNLHGYEDSCSLNLMQYTGLKDKNGKEVYEGDIVKHSRTREKERVSERLGSLFHIGEISWCEKDRKFEFAHRFKSGGGYSCSIGDSFLNDHRYNKTEIEIIGNIYENSELLNHEKDNER